MADVKRRCPEKRRKREKRADHVLKVTVASTFTILRDCKLPMLNFIMLQRLLANSWILWLILLLAADPTAGTRYAFTRLPIGLLLVDSCKN